MRGSRPTAANFLFSLTSTRYERAPTVFTSHKPFSAWGDIASVLVSLDP